MLADITGMATASPLYNERIHPIDRLDRLCELPLTGVDRIFRCYERYGREGTIIAPAEKVWKTSGYTGVSKDFHCAADLESICGLYAEYAITIGVRSSDAFWNLAGDDPMMTGAVFSNVARLLEVEDVTTTLLRKDTDFIRSLKVICHQERLDIVASPALLFYLLTRACVEDNFVREAVAKGLISNYRVPGFLARPLSRLIAHGVDETQLRTLCQGVRFGFSYAEPVSPYLEWLCQAFPAASFIDVYGSTECPAIAAQYSSDDPGLSLMLSFVIPELADPNDLHGQEVEDEHDVSAVPWTQWSKGQRGELLVTRPGGCLPLIRYPTGDMIEVLNPWRRHVVEIDGRSVTFHRPMIQIMGRGVDTLDFEVEDEMESLLGNKIYSRHIKETLQSDRRLRWWELYKVNGSPGRLEFVVYPIADGNFGLQEDVIAKLVHKVNDYHHTFAVAYELGLLEVRIMPASAYAAIQREIDARARASNSLGQLKPKHIFVMSSQAELESHLDSRSQA